MEENIHQQQCPPPNQRHNNAHKHTSRWILNCKAIWFDYCYPATSIRRYRILLNKQVNPISDLQNQLGAGDHLIQLPKMIIDWITNKSWNTRYKIELKNYTRDRWMMDTDGILQNKFLHTKIKHAIADNRNNSIELNILKLWRITTIGDVIQLNNDNKNILRRIMKPELSDMLESTDNIYAGIPIPDKINHQTILDVNKNRWLRCSNITLRQTRLLMRNTEIITNTKLTVMAPNEATHSLKTLTNCKVHKTRLRCYD